MLGFLNQRLHQRLLGYQFVPRGSLFGELLGGVFSRSVLSVSVIRNDAELHPIPCVLDTEATVLIAVGIRGPKLTLVGNLGRKVRPILDGCVDGLAHHTCTHHCSYRLFRRHGGRGFKQRLVGQRGNGGLCSGKALSGYHPALGAVLGIGRFVIFNGSPIGH